MRTALAAVLTGALSASTFAATWTVDDDGADYPDADFASIQDAVDAASEGDTVLVYPGTYTSSGSSNVVVVDKDLTLEAVSGPDVTIIDGEYSIRCMKLSGTSNASVITGFTLTNGLRPDGAGGAGILLFNSNATIHDCLIVNCQAGGGGGIYVNASAPTFDNCAIEDCYAINKGGGVLSQQDSAPRFQNCTFTECLVGNTTNARGGAVDCSGSGSIEFESCVFDGNYAPSYGGAIHCNGSVAIALSDCLFDSNISIYGGGIRIEDDATIAAEYCTFNNNFASTYGGALTLVGSASGTLANSELTQNSAYLGAGIAVDAATLNVSNCTIHANNGYKGLGAFLEGGTASTFTNCTFSDHEALLPEDDRSAGAGLYINNESTTVTLTDCTIQNNTAELGGGIYAKNDALVTANSCLINGNTAGQGGGVMYRYGTTFIMQGGTVSNNTAYFDDDPYISFGGGVFGGYAASAVVDATISGNTAYWGGGAMPYADDLNMSNSTVQNNHAEVGGGGVFVFRGGEASLVNCGVLGNTTNFLGAAMGMWKGEGGFAHLVNCTVTGNASTKDSGGVFAQGGCKVIFESCNVTGNTAADENSNGSRLYDSSYFDFRGHSEMDALRITHNSTGGVFRQGASCGVTGDVVFSDNSYMAVELTTANGMPFLDADGDVYLSGSLSVLNTGGSLDNVSVGDLFPIISAASTTGSFSSVVTPLMAEELDLRWLDSGNGAWTLKVVASTAPTIDDPVDHETASQPLELRSEDLLNNGDDELLAMFDGMPGSIAAFSVTGGAPTAIEGLIASTGPSPVDMDSGDLNGDGLGDVIVANAGDGTLTVLLGDDEEDRGRSFHSTTINVANEGHTLTCAAIINWDGDAWPDVVVGFNKNNDELESAFRIILDVGSSAPAAGDLIEVPPYLLSGPEGGFMDTDEPRAVDGLSQQLGFIGGSCYGRVAHYSPGRSTGALIGDLGGYDVDEIVMADVDGDGFEDMLCGSIHGKGLLFVPGSGGVAWGDPIPLIVGDAIRHVTVSDVDDDGDADIVITTDDAESGMRLLRNEGTPLGARTLLGGNWSQHTIGGGGTRHGHATGNLNNKGEEEDWGVGGGLLNPPLRGGEPAQGLMLVQFGDHTQSCPEDVDGSGVVNIEDLLLVIGNFNGGGQGDVNSDGTVNIEDLLLIIGAWGASC